MVFLSAKEEDLRARCSQRHIASSSMSPAIYMLVRKWTPKEGRSCHILLCRPCQVRYRLGLPELGMNPDSFLPSIYLSILHLHDSGGHCQTGRHSHFDVSPDKIPRRKHTDEILLRHDGEPTAAPLSLEVWRLHNVGEISLLFR